jgi:hypothetical protein
MRHDFTHADAETLQFALYYSAAEWRLRALVLQSVVKSTTHSLWRTAVKRVRVAHFVAAPWSSRLSTVPAVGPLGRAAVVANVMRTWRLDGSDQSEVQSCRARLLI